MAKSLDVDQELLAYARARSIPADEIVTDLIAETGRLGEPARMQTDPLQGPFLYLLVRLTGARSVLEIGTFTGMSALWMARALPPDGRILCCDVSEEYTSIARRAWARAGVSDRIELRIGPALETVESLADGTTFDVAFIDADKPAYPDYLDAVVPRLAPGGLLVGDNVLWRGRVLDRSDRSEGTEAIRRFNDAVAAHPDLEAVVLPVADGMTLARKVS